MPAVKRPAWDEVSLASLEFWASTPQQREQAFAQLRDTRPVSWQPPARGGLLEPGPDDEGFWAVTGYSEITYVSRHPELFCNSKGFLVDEVPREFYAAAGSILGADPPEHTALRRLVAAAFTPKRVRQIEAQIRRQAERIVDDLLNRSETSGDFVREVAARLPMWTISEMMGVPEQRRQEITDVAMLVNSYNDPEIRGDRTPQELMAYSMGRLHEYAGALAADRRRALSDDVMTALVHAEIDGQKLTDPEICSFFLLLVVAGNDTTRNATSITMRWLTEHPEQRALLVSDLDRHMPTAVEEFLRWSTPVMTFSRRATQDVELGGQQIRSGDKVVMYYPASNFDENVYPDPWRFDITRQPNNHHAFGAGGPHFCLGAPLARAQLRAMFSQLLTRVPDIEVGEPEYELSNFIRSVKRMSYRFTPAEGLR